MWEGDCQSKSGPTQIGSGGAKIFLFKKDPVEQIYQCSLKINGPP